MILIKGWDPISRVRLVVLNSWLIPRPEGRWAEAAPRGEQISGAYKLLEATARKLTKLSLVLVDGTLKEASLDLLDGEWVKSSSRDVGLFYGTVGSGYIKDGFEDMEPWAQDRELRLRYGPFLGCPLMVQESELEAIRGELYPSYTGPLDGLADETAAFDRTLEADQPKRGRGQPMKGNGAIADAVLNEFRTRYPDGLPFGELDGIYATAVEWVKKQYNVDISISTARRYLLSLPRVSLKTEN